MEPIPAADLDRAQLRMVEGLPIDVRRPAKLCFAPAKDLQVVCNGVIAEPVDIEVLFNARLAHRAPDLHHPAEHAQVVVDPVESAPDNLLRMVAKLVIDG